MEVVAMFIFMVFGLGIPFGYAAYSRSRKHQEIMALIEKGMYEMPKKSNGKGALRWGIVIAFLGMALCLGLYPLGVIFGNGEFPLGFGPWMLLGLIPTFFGLALVVVYFVTRDPEPEKSPKAAQPAPELLQEVPEEDQEA